MDIRELRGMFGKHSQRSWQQIMTQAKEIKLPNAQSPLWFIKKHISQFKPVTID